MIVLFTQPFITVFNRKGDRDRTPKKVPQVGEDTTPTKSTVSGASTFAVSFASDVSGFDDEEPVELLSREFYSIVTKEREKLHRGTEEKAFRWAELKLRLDEANNYFKHRTLSQIRNRYKNIKKELIKLK